MARKARIHAPGAVYHVVLRGNSRQDIFNDDKDRHHFYSVLEASCKRYDHRIHAFCLMTNHVHLEVQVGTIPLSRIMQTVSQRYTQWFNFRHNRCGHLFQGRYKAVMVDSDEYLLELTAYIHLNPVRAGVADQPHQHRWSSHRAYMGKESYPWLHTSFVLSQFSTDVTKSHILFARFVEERASQGHRQEFHGAGTIDSRIVGDDTFLEAVLAEAEEFPLQRPDARSVIEAVKKLFQVTDEDLSTQSQGGKASEARAAAAWAIMELSSGTLTDLAKYTRRDISTLSCAVQRLLKRQEKEPELFEKMRRLRQELLAPEKMK